MAELKAAVDRLAATPGIDAKRLVLVGHDFGAMFGVLMAAEEPRLRWYVLMAGVPTMSEWYLLGKKSPAPDYATRLSALDPAAALTKAKPQDVLFQFASKDRYVPEARARLFADGVKTKTVKIYDADHDLAVEAAFQDRLAWLKEKLAR